MTETAPEVGGGMSPRTKALLIIVVIIALLGIAFLLLAGGGGEPDDSGFPTGLPTATRSPTRGPTASPSPTRTAVPETDDFFEGKDPFEPLVDAGATPGPGNGNGGPSPTPTATSTTPTDGDGETVVVSLDDIFTEDGTRFATVSVDGDQFTVAEGDTFADNFRVLDLTSNCGTFVFGDERFTLCLGQEVRK